MCENTREERERCRQENQRRLGKQCPYCESANTDYTDAWHYGWDTSGPPWGSSYPMICKSCDKNFRWRPKKK